jgi:hypothetical protein
LSEEHDWQRGRCDELLDAAEIKFAGVGEYTTIRAGIFYGPRVLPIWQRIDGEWEQSTDRIIKVVDFRDD